MRVSRVFRVSLIVAAAALALSGCMQRRGPVARAPQTVPVVAQPIVLVNADLDAFAYGGRSFGGPPVAAAPPPIVMARTPHVAAAPIVAPSRPGLLTGLFKRKPHGHIVTGAIPVAAVAPAMLHDPAYRLDAGDRLRIVVFGQEGLSNSYAVDAAGVVTLPLIGAVAARGCTPAELAAAITSRLQNGFIREPYVAVEIEAYRPFFILGEVAAPGQYPYVPNMTAESAVAIAGGFTPRAKRSVVRITRGNAMAQIGIVASPNAPIQPGDTIVIGERWF